MRLLIKKERGCDVFASPPILRMKGYLPRHPSVFTSLSVDELLSVLDKDSLCILAYTLALQVVNWSILVKLLLNGNVVNASSSACYREVFYFPCTSSFIRADIFKPDFDFLS